jgi:hypothetical protein
VLENVYFYGIDEANRRNHVEGRDRLPSTGGTPEE